MIFRNYQSCVFIKGGLTSVSAVMGKILCGMGGDEDDPLQGQVEMGTSLCSDGLGCDELSRPVGRIPTSWKVIESLEI